MRTTMKVIGLDDKFNKVGSLTNWCVMLEQENCLSLLLFQSINVFRAAMLVYKEHDLCILSRVV